MTEPNLDYELCDVPLPSGLLARLRALPLIDDEGLDEVIRDISLPHGMLDRLQAIPLADDDGLDEALRNVPVPARLESSWQGRRKRRDRARHASRMALAASLFIGITLTLGSAILISRAFKPGSKQAAGTSFVGNERKPDVPLESSWSMQADEAANSSVPSKPDDLAAIAAPIDFARLDGPTSAFDNSPAASPMLPAQVDLLARQAAHVSVTNNWDDLPELPTRVANPVPHGLDWPLVAESHRAFLIKYGVHPFVTPAAHSRLQTCQVPLAVDPASYELARRYVERNELPPADRIRTEEFLAAVDYKFPEPKQRDLGLTISGGPSPIGGEGFCLLQVGVQARRTTEEHHAPVHLVLLVDTSTSMRWGSRIEIVRRAMHDLPQSLGPDDRISLVAFNQAAHVLIENVGPGEMDEFIAAVDSLAAEGSTNLGSGLSEAYTLARTRLGAGHPAIRVVLLTDGLLDLDPPTAQQVEQQVTQAASHDLPLHLIDLGQQKDADPEMAAMAHSGRGTVHRAVSADQLRSAMREIVTGRSQLAARGARLQVNFNPKTVLEYRLIGHESGDWAGLLPGAVEADFREGQSATALFEVRLAPDGPQNLATVDLTWYSPDTSRAGKAAERVRSPVERKDIAASFAKSAPWLQEAAVVAYTAEVLRRSPFVFRRQGLNVSAALFRGFELAGQADSRLNQIPSFAEFFSLIGQEIKAHPARRAAKE